MKVLVTGATGFLGSYIVDKCIEQGDDVRVLVRKTSDTDYLKKYTSIEYAYGDVTDKESLEKATEGVDIVYHSAARAADWGTRKQFMDANYHGTVSLVEASMNNKVKRFVFVSSPSIIFNYKDEIYIDESHPHPKVYANYYSESKGLAEKYVLSMNGENGMTTVAVRPHAIWGPRDRVGFLPQFLSKIASGKLKDLSDGKEPKTDLCYADNAALGCILAAKSEKAAGKVYFLTDDESIKIWDYVHLFSRIFNLPPIEEKVNLKAVKAITAVIEFIWKIPYLARTKRPPITRYSIGMLTCSTTYNINAAKEDLGYKPEINVEEGLEILKKWIEEIGGIDEFIKYC